MIVQSFPSAADAWLLVVAPRSVLALPATEAGRAAELTVRLAGADGFRWALESLLDAGIASAPSFALLDGDAAALRVVLRGEAAVTAGIAGTETTFSGAGMATWTERVLEGVRSVRLTVPGSSWGVLLGAGAASEPAGSTLAPHPDPEGVQADPDPEAYDFLFGDTVYRTQAGAAIRIPNPDPQRPGDHDGRTVLAGDLGPAGRAAAMPGEPAPVPPGASGPAPVPAPVLALHLERSDGSREPLGRPVLIGRSPTAAAASRGLEPRLLTIADDPDISRTHLRVDVEGEAVVVTDLGSKNGTLITLPGAAPRRLRASEPTVVLPGTLIDLGGGTTFVVRED